MKDRPKEAPLLPGDKPGTREFDIDAFRGLVCLCLIVLHFYTGSMWESWHRMGGDAAEYAVWNLRLGVESFFVLAGFMMAHMLRPTSGETVSLIMYLKRRFLRLMIPYWIAVLLATADKWLVFLVLKRGKDLPGVWEVFTQITLLQEFFHVREAAIGYWSMVALEQFYLIWLAIYAVIRWLFLSRSGEFNEKSIGSVMAFLTLAGGLASAAVVMFRVEINWELAKFGIYLSLGMLLYWAIRQGRLRWMFAIGVVALAAVAIVTEESRPIKGLLAVAVFVPLARGKRLPKAWLFRSLAYIGYRSYSFYLMHAIVGQRVFSFATKLTSHGDWVAFPFLAVALVLTFAVSLAFYNFVESPCREWARQVKYRRDKPIAFQPAIAPADSSSQSPTSD